MVEDIKSGVMAAFTKVIGNATKLMVVEDSFMLMETFMTDIGRMIKPMDMDNILIPMVLNTKATGSTISSTVKAKSTGQMVHNTKEHINSVKRTDMDNSSGPIDLATMETLLTIIFTARVHIPGLMAEFTMETGNRIKCTEEVYSHGPMVGSTKENTSTIRNKDMESSTGQMVVSMMGTGWLESKKELVSTLMLKVTSATEDGRVENVSDG
jgi:hypothetical protein